MADKPKQSNRTLWIILGVVGLLILAGIIFVACSSRTPAPTPTPVSTNTSAPAPTPVVIDVNKLYANPWVLVSYGDPANPTVVSGGLVLTLNFTSDGQISGFGGCNNFNGTVQVSTDGTMTVGPLATTMMACPQGMDQETAYLSALQNAHSFNYTSEGRLQIMFGPESGANQAMVFSVGAASLTGTNWVLVSSGDPANPSPVPTGSVVTAFFYEDGSVSGYSGCNQYATTYTVQNDQMTLGPVATTQMACATGMEVEQAYLQAFSTASQFTITGQKLTIKYNQGAGVLNYTSANLPLENTEWTLNSMNGQSLAADVNITALFTPGETAGSGDVSGSSGCNTYSAGYTLNGNNITVSQAASTMMYCESGMETEQAYMQALQASTSYQILADKLVLTSASGNLTFTANRTPLTGALWSLVALGDVTKPEQPVKGSAFTAQFILIPGAPSGVLNGTTGCNEYTTAFAATVDQLKINQPVATQNTSCVPGLTNQEKTYFLALADATTYHITGNSLTIPYDSGKQALVFEGTQLEGAKRPPLSSLNGSTWYLWYNGNTPTLAGTNIYGQFAINSDGASGTMSGSAGCNTYVASFGNDMGVQATLNAKQNCNAPKGVMDQESSYITVLARAFGYWQTGDQLIVNTGLGALTYHTTPPPSSADQTHLLVGTAWYLVSYNQTNSLPGKQEPYTQFNTDGTLAGYTGCNTFQANYTTNVQAISISNLNAAQEACPNSNLQAQQDAMLNILGSAKSYQVSSTVMQIVSDSGALNYSLTPVSRPEEVARPVAAFDAPQEAPVNTVVKFDATPSTSGVPITYYEWNFGDGNTGAGQVVEHVYNTATNYDVVLTVTDELGYQSTLQKRLVIFETTAPTPTPTATTPPTAVPTGTPPPTQPPQPTATAVPTEAPQEPPKAAITGPGNGYVGEPVVFDASGSVAGSSSIVSYSWNFGDGTTAGPSAETSQTTLYNQTGTFPVSVVVTDQNGLSSSATTQVTIASRLGTPVEWALNKLGNQSLIPGTAITIVFQSGQFAGFGGCNSYNGAYTATDNGNGTYTVVITGLVNTGMSCPADIMSQEQAYFGLLSTVTTAQVQGNALTLTSPNGALVYYQAGTPTVSPY